MNVQPRKTPFLLLGIISPDSIPMDRNPLKRLRTTAIFRTASLTAPGITLF